MTWLKALLSLLPRILDVVHERSIARKRKRLEQDINAVSKNVAKSMAGESGRVQHSNKTLDDLRSDSPSSESDSAG